MSNATLEFLVPHPKRIQQFKDNLEIKEDMLEIGIGSGVISAYCYSQGAKVTGVDINPHAVNFVKRQFPEIDCRISDLFENVDGKFDYIIFAAPWSEGKIRRPLDYALYDNGVVEKFLIEALHYLNAGGTVWLQYCDAFPNLFQRLPQWIKNGDLYIEDEWRYENFGRLVRRNVNVILYKLKKVMTS